MFIEAISLLVLLAAPATQTDAASLRVMSFNLRYASENSPNTWHDRRPVMKELLLKRSPDLLGTQEGLKDQLRDIDSDLGDAYTRFGVSRQGNDQDEFGAVFYRKDRLKVLDHGDFWLSDTPDIAGSKSWGNTLPRIVTFATFEDLKTGTKFVFLNTHFDNASEVARIKSAELLRDRVNAIVDNLPVIITGDFNAAAGQSEVWKILLQARRLRDAWDIASSRGESCNTFHNFMGAFKNGARIDWILTRNAASVQSIEIETFTVDGQYPSDHFPVIAQVVLPRTTDHQD